MGNQRVSVRTLPDGYKVVHHPPTDAHPDGKQVLQPGQSRLRERLHAGHDAHKEAHAAHHERRCDLVERKRARMKANGVPAEKRCV